MSDRLEKESSGLNMKIVCQLQSDILTSAQDKKPIELLFYIQQLEKYTKAYQELDNVIFDEDNLT